MKKVARVIFFLFVALFLIVRFYSATEDDYYTDSSEREDDDYDAVDTVQNEIRLIHNRVWRDFDDSQRSLQYSVSTTAANASSNYRNTIEVEYDGRQKVFWKDLYFGLYDHDQPQLTFLQDSILSLAKRERIEVRDLIYSVVSFIQDIPYNYIISTDSCASHTDHPCIPKQRYGVLSPVEFLYSLAGDCDTRTVLLFTLLKKLGYDPIIVNSAQYRHSMLAVSVPTEGDYFIHKGRKFYFWETTATGWLPGMLPPDMNNTDYWTIILDYEFQTDPTRNY
ncbi:MAG: hypothetical protein JJE09_03125 [Bacteroidia bacterium]|nr:hypothetical protein [Bacteroidia bacterium]